MTRESGNQRKIKCSSGYFTGHIGDTEGMDTQILDKLDDEGAIAKEIDKSAELKSSIQENIIEIELTISQGEVKTLVKQLILNSTHPLLNPVDLPVAKEHQTFKDHHERIIWKSPRHPVILGYICNNN